MKSLLALLPTLPFVQAEESFAPVKPFLTTYCVECHGPNKQKGEVRLDDIHAIDGALWANIYDQIQHSEMPPEDEKQPSQEKRALIAKLVDQISRDDSFSISTGYRRLNRSEYSNTVRELLGLKSELYDPAARIFEDEIDHAFDTNAHELVISNELLLEYLDSAERSLRTALYLDSFDPPSTKTTSFNPSKFKGGNQRYTTYKKKSVVFRGPGTLFSKEASQKITVAGNYRITVSAAGVDRDNYPIKMPPISGPIKVSVGSRLDGRIGEESNSRHIKTFDLKDEEFETIEIEMWLEKGAYPWVRFANGAGKPAATIRSGIRRKKLKPSETPKNYRGPGVEIASFTIEGPLDLEWPPATYKTIFHTDEIPDFDKAKVRADLIKKFVTRAYRRPVKEAELQDYQIYLNQQHRKTESWHEAFIKTFAAVMSSPDFLYIKEPIGELPPFALANRLSYFLWSAMPDLELFKLAYTEDLLTPEVYAAQIDRLIEDPRSSEFVNRFATQWLSLDVLGTMRPGTKGPYKAYYKGRYESAIRTETLTYFRHILFENQPIGDFLDSDYTFLNNTLAQAYDIPFKGDAAFKKVTLPEDSIRGGLLGHGSILSLTSNGVETLPVTRGHWVLDELLGIPPPPPPEEVPALVPDLTGVDTPRAQLVRHREDPSCFECHKQMDPIGLALENFDVIGRYREKYEKRGPKIDPAGEIKGSTFKTLPKLRKLLRAREHEFAISLTSKIAEYAKGRKLNRNDLELVEQIATQAKADDYRFRSLLRRILMSKLMRNR